MTVAEVVMAEDPDDAYEVASQHNDEILRDNELDVLRVDSITNFAQLARLDVNWDRENIRTVALKTCGRNI